MSQIVMQNIFRCLLLPIKGLGMVFTLKFIIIIDVY